MNLVQVTIISLQEFTASSLDSVYLVLLPQPLPSFTCRIDTVWILVKFLSLSGYQRLHTEWDEVLILVQLFLQFHDQMVLDYTLIRLSRLPMKVLLCLTTGFSVCIFTHPFLHSFSIY